MTDTIFEILGHQLRNQRAERGLNQDALAARVGRNRARVSELERDLIGNRWGRDRLTLIAEMCDAMDLILVLIPRARAAEIIGQLSGGAATLEPRTSQKSPFEELFVDLGSEREKGAD